MVREGRRYQGRRRNRERALLTRPLVSIFRFPTLRQPSASGLAGRDATRYSAGTSISYSRFPRMSVLKRINWVTASFLVVTPLVAVVWGGVHIALFGVSPFEVALFALYIAATGFSITAGYHRHFAHGAYECRRFVKAFYLLFGAAAFQHSVLNWSSDHRRHHLNIDEDLDPYNIKGVSLGAHRLADDEVAEPGRLLQRSRPGRRSDGALPAPLLRAVGDHHGLRGASRDRVCDGTPVGLLALGRGVPHRGGPSLHVLREFARPYSRQAPLFDRGLGAGQRGDGAADLRRGVSQLPSPLLHGLSQRGSTPSVGSDQVADPRHGGHRLGVGIVPRAAREDRRRRARVRRLAPSRTLEGPFRRCDGLRAGAHGGDQSRCRALGRAARDLERQLVRARTTLGEEGHRQIERLRAELRAARREFRLARSRWRASWRS